MALFRLMGFTVLVGFLIFEVLSTKVIASSARGREGLKLVVAASGRCFSLSALMM